MTSHADQRLEAGRVAVRFAPYGDRTGHEILLFDGRDWTCLLASVEGTPDEPWPASPPLQSLHIERRAGSLPVALLVGMAGKSHWSVSIEVDAAAESLRFDVACRLRGPSPTNLGSRYRVCDASGRPVTRAQSHSELVIPPIGPMPGWRLRVDERFAGTKMIVTATPEIVIAPPVPSDSDEPTTIRWGYAIAVS